jgi:uncharacterized protein YbcI
LIKNNQEDLLYLSNTFSKLLKRSFGKGPESSFTHLRDGRLFVYMRNFITPGEEILIDSRQTTLALNFRFKVIQAVSKQILDIVRNVLGSPFDMVYQDWNYSTNTGMLLITSQDVYNKGKIDTIFEEDLFDAITKVASDYHKVPNKLTIIKSNSNVCAVEAEGSIQPLAQALYESGDINLLYRGYEETKKGYFKQKSLFEKAFNRSIDDLFIMWDFEQNKNYYIFNFEKVYT